MDKAFIAKKIASNIRQLMNESELSNAELARKSDISSGTIHKILNATMNMSVNMAYSIAKGLDCEIRELFEGLDTTLNTNKKKTKTSDNRIVTNIGILSIDNKRYTCICDQNRNIIGQSELIGGLDIVESSGALSSYIFESINNALSKQDLEKINLKKSKLNLVTQSHEFEEVRRKFKLFMEKQFQKTIIMSDWQITYFSEFDCHQGISLILDKGTSLSFMEGGKLHKLGGWKFPIYDYGGENWIGNEAIKHTIECAEGYIPMSALAKDILSNYSNKIEKITEVCLKSKNADIYSDFAKILIKHYHNKEKISISIIERGYIEIDKFLKQAYKKIGGKVNIAITGSLKNIYLPLFQKHEKIHKLIESSSIQDKILLLANINSKYLNNYGVDY